MEKVSIQYVIVDLPDGRKLLASEKKDPQYPGVRIELVKTDGTKEDIAWVDYNAADKDRAPEQRLRSFLWNAGSSDHIVSVEYDTGEVKEES